MPEPLNIGRALLDVPFPELVRQMGLSIAEAQYALDKVSIRITQLMAGFKEDEEGNMVQDPTALILLAEGAEPLSLLSLGFTPTFYQYTDTVFEIKMALSMSLEKEVGLSTSVSAGGSIGFSKRNYATASASVNASYAQKYQYSAEGSSLMRTKLVSLPAPTILEERIRFELARAQEEAAENS